MTPIVLVVMAVLVVYLRPRALANPPGLLARLPQLAPVPPGALSAPAAWRAAAVDRVPAARAALALAGVETRRLIRSPLFAAAFALIVVNVVAPGSDREFDIFNAFALAGPAGLWCGLICYFAGNLAATRARRHGAAETFGAGPLSPRLRVLALVVPALVASLLFFLVLLAGVTYWYDVREVPFARPGPWHLLSLPVQVLGGFTLGVMVATWAPFRGVAPAVFFALVTVHVVLANEDASAWGAYVTYARWPDQGGGFEPISPGWHLLYMVLLCAMAVVGALVWLPGRRRGLLTLGAALTLSAIGAGLAQHP
jgi:hypothetical protein